MKNSFLIFTILFSSINYAQNKTFVLEDYIIKVKPIKSNFNKAVCDTANKHVGVITEFEVLNEVDIKKFGNKIYAMDVCANYPGDGVFNSNYIWDLKISEQKFYLAEIKIVNEELSNRNIFGKKYWIRDLSRKVILDCNLKQSSK
ncbi:hypothetical protein GCM10022422_26800 [Flavobacterium ginsengisoli]|uniref:Uncharacterized protein n=1 Tax=Flavobacterium ginsengisoli TaxID=871694 RepID=A0ABP7FJT7_9FLAO|nr:hypothetical protein [Flavobacterium ginsengisoli]